MDVELQIEVERIEVLFFRGLKRCDCCWGHKEEVDVGNWRWEWSGHGDDAVKETEHEVEERERSGKEGGAGKIMASYSLRAPLPGSKKDNEMFVFFSRRHVFGKGRKRGLH